LVSKVLTLVLENVNGLAVLGGAIWLYVGVAGFSRPAADIVAGVLLLTVGVVPYLRRAVQRRRH
jgi:hypothetical protein